MLPLKRGMGVAHSSNCHVLPHCMAGMHLADALIMCATLTIMRGAIAIGCFMTLLVPSLAVGRWTLVGWSHLRIVAKRCIRGL